MNPRATVLYEDSKIGKEYPLHHLLLRMVEDEINGQTWRLRKAVTDNPRKGVDKVLADVRVTSMIAGEGLLFVLVDRDRIVQHLNRYAEAGASQLDANATDDEVAAAMLGMSDAPDKLRVFLLHPNIEGLIAAIEACAPGQWAEDVARARAKDRIARDVVLGEIAKAAMATVRACVRGRQPGLDALATALAAFLPTEAIA